MNNLFLETDALVAIYMVSSKKDKVISDELYKFNEFLTSKIMEKNLNLTQDHRFHPFFLLSDLYLLNLNWQKPRFFHVSKKDENNTRQICCDCAKTTEQNLEDLKTNLLSGLKSQNPEFFSALEEIANEYSAKQEKSNEKTSFPKILTQEQDDQRWWNYFGK